MRTVRYKNEYKNEYKTRGWKPTFRRLLGISVFGSCLLSTGAWAEAPDWQQFYTADAGQRAAYVPVGKDYALGINRFDLDEHTEILGWQISKSWYFGRQDGLDSGLTLVWQSDANQVSLSKDGVRLTRRF